MTVDAVTLRVYKSFGSQWAKPWVNTYDLALEEGEGELGTTDPLLYADAANQIVIAEQKLHLNSTYFVRYTISTYKPDSTPYDEDALISVPLNGQGTRGVGAQPAILLDTRICLGFRRARLRGNPGSLAYRNCLVEDDVQAVGGRYTLMPEPTPSLLVASGELETLLKGSLFGGVKMVMISGTGYDVLVDGRKGSKKLVRRYRAPFRAKNVVNVRMSGVRIVEDDHGYFNQGAGPTRS